MLTMALTAEPNIRPMMSKETLDLTRNEAISTIPKTMKEPKAEAKTRNQLLPNSDNSIKPPSQIPRKITMATPKPPPELIPKIKGPASGFLNKVCIWSPLIARALPARMAVSALGIRKSIIILSHMSFPVFPKRDERTSDKGMLTEPSVRLRKKVKIKVPKRIRKMPFHFWGFDSVWVSIMATVENIPFHSLEAIQDVEFL